MSWECKYKVGDDCRKLGGRCDPGRKGCVLHGKVYFPFAPEKNPKNDDPSSGDSASGTTMSGGVTPPDTKSPGP